MPATTSHRPISSAWSPVSSPRSRAASASVQTDPLPNLRRLSLIFRASVDAQGGAYATGVLVLMTSAAVAVTLSARWAGGRGAVVGFGAIALVFAYTTVVNVVERPDGVKIAGFFIAAIVAVSLVSRLWRTLELRVERIELDETARRFIEEADRGEIRVVANQPDERDVAEYK